MVEGMHKKTKQDTIFGKIHSTIFIGHVRKKIPCHQFLNLYILGGVKHNITP